MLHKYKSAISLLIISYAKRLRKSYVKKICMNVKNLAIIVFNRPELTEKVMLEIKKAKPENFFYYC